MSTLYELLGALSHDNAEELRTAFRKAVKGTHPDLKPDDPDAALKFREIVRAKEILGDPEQREVYDHLLDLARIEEESASSRQAVAAKIHSLASAVIAFTGASVVIIGGYLLYAYASSSGSFASANDAAVGVTATQLAVASLPNSLPTTEVSAEIGRKPLPAEPVAFRSMATTHRGPHLDLIENAGVGSIQELRFNHDDDFAIASLSPALQPAVIFYRQQKIAGASPMLPAKSIQQPKICTSVPKITRRPRVVQNSEMPLALSIFQTRRTAMDISREKRIALIR
jgi:curved DNA-binding protein CbpA